MLQQTSVPYTFLFQAKQHKQISRHLLLLAHFPLRSCFVTCFKLIFREIFWIEAQEPYPELDRGQLIRRASGLVRSNRYIHTYLLLTSFH